FELFACCVKYGRDIRAAQIEPFELPDLLRRGSKHSDDCNTTAQKGQRQLTNRRHHERAKGQERSWSTVDGSGHFTAIVVSGIESCPQRLVFEQAKIVAFIEQQGLLSTKIKLAIDRRRCCIVSAIGVENQLLEHL